MIWATVSSRSCFYWLYKAHPSLAAKKIINLILFARVTIWWCARVELSLESESEVAQSCPTLCDPVDCSLQGFSIHGIIQAKILEWVAISFSRGSSRPRDQTWVSSVAGKCFNLWATREARVISWVFGIGCLLWPVCSLGKTLLAFALLHFVLQWQSSWLFLVSLDFILSHFNLLWW